MSEIPSKAPPPPPSRLFPPLAHHDVDVDFDDVDFDFDFDGFDVDVDFVDVEEYVANQEILDKFVQ